VSASATLTGVQIVPSTAQILTSTLGKQYQFTLAGTFSDGSTGFLTGSATWSSTNQNVATVAAGLATSTGYGTTTITATVNGLTATASLTVSLPTLLSIVVTPSTPTIYQGTAIQLKATGTYADGSSVDVTSTVTWSSSDINIANVSATGLVQSFGLGTATITATHGSITGTASLTVVPPFAWTATGSNGASATVSSGATANFALALAPDKNFTGLVAFACTNLTPNSVCTVAPPSANVTTGSPVSVAVTIKTGQLVSAQTYKVPLIREIAFAVLPALLLLLLPSTGYRRVRRFGSAALLLTVLYCCVSCGGGSGNTGTSGGSSTPSGSYTVVVTASSAGDAPQRINLTIIVQ
jgi:hypothetical protein